MELSGGGLVLVAAAGGCFARPIRGHKGRGKGTPPWLCGQAKGERVRGECVVVCVWQWLLVCFVRFDTLREGFLQFRSTGGWCGYRRKNKRALRPDHTSAHMRHRGMTDAPWTAVRGLWCAWWLSWTTILLLPSGDG
jgi:hypothetical protein